jgi:hypothetical protein
MLVFGKPGGINSLTPAVPGYEGSTGQTAGIYEFCAISYTRKWFFREFFGKKCHWLPRKRAGKYSQFWFLPITCNAGIVKFRQGWPGQGRTVSGMLRLIGQKALGEAQRQAKTLFSYGGRAD